jgi:hypothetical protein
MEPRFITGMGRRDGNGRRSAMPWLALSIPQDAEKGGTYSTMSDAGDMFYIAQTWKEVIKTDIKLIPNNDVGGMRELAMAYKKAHPVNE